MPEAAPGRGRGARRSDGCLAELATDFGAHAGQEDLGYRTADQQCGQQIQPPRPHKPGRRPHRGGRVVEMMTVSA